MASSEHRRRFLLRCGWLATGAALGVAAKSGWDLAAPAWSQEKAGPSAEARLRELRIELPPVTPPTATYVPAVRVGDLLFVAGHGPNYAGVEPLVGKVGKDFDLPEAQAAARRVGLRILSTVRDAVGSLDNVVRVVKTLGMVNATPDFTQHSQVINAASDLMVEVFGPEAGKGARSAVGMGSLPTGMPVEIEMVFQLRPLKEEPRAKLL
jgi:enamine deaminase RidA (YjgF/YER057c/UK114 family)